MTANYDIDTDVGKVRLATGDKDMTDVIFTDEEIDIFLAVNDNSINMASADLLEAWAATYLASASNEKIGDYAYTQKIVDNMLKQAARLRETESAIPAFEWSEPDLTSGSAITAEED